MSAPIRGSIATSASHPRAPHISLACGLQRPHPAQSIVAASLASSSPQVDLLKQDVQGQGSTSDGVVLGRRELLLATLATQSLLGVNSAQAIQGLTAGRIPGLSNDADGDGFYTYMRPEGKSGGHGVGWSEIPRYAFKVPAGWGEIPVSIADLGGTEIDLRYTSKDQGDAAVVVAPIMRFADIGFNAKVTIEQLGEPDKIIKGFAPEIFGKPIEDEDILDSVQVKKGSLTYYNYYIKPYRLVSTTAFGNRIFILSITATARQWRKHEAELRKIANSFVVPDGLSA